MPATLLAMERAEATMVEMGKDSRGKQRLMAQLAWSWQHAISGKSMAARAEMVSPKNAERRGRCAKFDVRTGENTQVKIHTLDERTPEFGNSNGASMSYSLPITNKSICLSPRQNNILFLKPPNRQPSRSTPPIFSPPLKSQIDLRASTSPDRNQETQVVLNQNTFSVS